MARQYTTLAAVKAVLGFDAGDTTQDAAILAKIEEATSAVEGEAGTVFVAYTDTKAFDAPAPSANPWEYLAPDRGVVGSILTVPELLTVTSLTAYGQPLTEGTDFLVLTSPRSDTLPGQTRLLRVNGGRAVAWATNAQLPWQPRGAIVITDSWGYTTTPPVIVGLTEAIAVQLWHQRTRQYATTQTAPDGTTEPISDTLWTKARLKALAPYRQQATVLFA
jgi:hypothetical protein